MNKRTLLIMTLAALPVALFLAGCQKPAGDFGAALGTGEIIPIADIVGNPAAYEGQVVKVQGEITQECPTGCWFYLKENAASVMINLHPLNFAIPQAVGQTAIVEGTVKREGVQVEIVGTGVTLP